MAKSFQIVVALLLLGRASTGRPGAEDSSVPASSKNGEYPDGYFPFEESPSRTPPKVRRPPYAQADVDCPGIEEGSEGGQGVQSLDNLCGDLNKGYIPKSPLGRNVNGHSYPFDLIRNKTLDFFSSTLPILKADQNLPKVAKYEDFNVIGDRSSNPQIWKRRGRRNAPSEDTEATKEEEPAAEASEESVAAESFQHSGNKQQQRQGRGLCDKNYGIFCTIMNLINGRVQASLAGLGNPLERVENPDLLPSTNSYNNKHINNQIGDDPLTPCPSAAEYVTPVYAKNYQGVWRYVVQIPYEGYFTQTVEVTKCLRKRCHFMDGSCLASPRWVSLLVAELFYPHARFPATKPGAASNQGASFRSMGKSDKLRRLKPPSNLPEIPFIPRLMSSSSSETEEMMKVADGDDQDVDSAGREKRQADSSSKPTYCDGVDEIGCYQVRLYYDWLLVPGSCKCWKQDFFTKYGRKK